MSACKAVSLQVAQHSFYRVTAHFEADVLADWSKIKIYDLVLLGII
eukprot:SAG25_NODE_27_length_21065_cov_19.427931_11_plen_46_part_00